MTDLATTAPRVSGLLHQESVKKKFEEVLGKKAPAFISSIISAVSTNKALSECEPMSVVSAAGIAAAMDLPISPSLGLAHIVPYKGVAQFQIGWKGFVQLAMRSGQYKTINLCIVYEGEVKNVDRFTGAMEFSGKRDSEQVIGYLLYFKLLNGYEKYFYMTAEECFNHGKRYSRSFESPNGQWKNNFDAMALKTVCKLGLSKYGVLSIEMQTAMISDYSETIEGEVQVNYPDAKGPEREPQKLTSKRLSQAVSDAAEPDVV